MKWNPRESVRSSLTHICTETNFNKVLQKPFGGEKKQKTVQRNEKNHLQDMAMSHVCPCADLLNQKDGKAVKKVLGSGDHLLFLSGRLNSKVSAPEIIVA